MIAPVPDTPAAPNIIAPRETSDHTRVHLALVGKHIEFALGVGVTEIRCFLTAEQADDMAYRLKDASGRLRAHRATLEGSSR
jgi:hypothetical protein